MKGSFLTTIGVTMAATIMMVSAEIPDYSGDYKLVAATNDKLAKMRKTTELAPKRDFTLKLTALNDEKSQYRLSLHIGNNLNTMFAVDRSSEQPNTGDEGSSSSSSVLEPILKVGPVMSTKMYVAPPLSTVEEEMKQMLPTLNTIEYDAKSGLLILDGENGGTLRFTNNKATQTLEKPGGPVDEENTRV